MYRLLKKFSLPLVVTLLVSSIPVHALSNNSFPEQHSENSIVTPEPSKAKIVGEDTTKREKFAKHFMKDDFTYEAAVYPVAVHYQENGVWKDIDNSLSDSVDENNNQVLENKENNLKVNFAKKSAAKKLVSISKDGYKLSWNLVNSLKTDVAVDSSNTDALDSNTDDKNLSLKNLSSSVTYKEILEGIDLQYILLPEEIKENLILSEMPSQHSFTFELAAGNLDGKVNEDGSISFIDPKTSAEVFHFNAPYMVDANGASSEIIAVSLTKDKNSFLMTITPDMAWLKGSDRAFPVVIDPTVVSASDTASISDTHVSSNFPTTLNYASSKLIVGLNNVTGGSGINRAYLKFTLPTLTSADMVVNAVLNLYSGANSETQQQINAYKVTALWDPKTLNYQNSVSVTFDTTIHDVELAKNAGYYDWNITTIAKSWYTTDNNYGIMLKSNNEGVFGYNEFYSSEYTTQGYRPYLTIDYINASGLEDYWTYHAYDTGRAGTAYVNDYNGNFVFTHNDISMNGNRLPITLTHIFNSYEMSLNTGYGKGWRLSLAQTIDTTTINGTIYYIYIDADGTKHYFISGANPMHDESGLDLLLTKNADGSFVLKDKGYNEYTFNGTSSTKYLKNVKDSNGNTQSIEYDTSNRITKVTDPAGRFITLAYNSSSGLLETITDTSARVTSYGYTGTTLDTITYPDKKQSKYTYTASGNMTAAINFDGYKTVIEYYTSRPYRVKALKEMNNNDSTLGQETNITYNAHNGLNTFTNATGTAITYHFDNYGRTTSVVDNLGYVSSDLYGNTINGTTSDKNKMVASTQKQQPVMNIVKNPGAERDSTDFGVVVAGGSTGSGSIVNTEKHTGQRSYKIDKTNQVGQHYYQQGLILQKNLNYIIQGYIKTTGVSNSNNLGASLVVTYLDSNGVWQKAQTRIINGTHDWTRVGVGFTVSNDITDVYVKLMMDGESGTAYFDTIQVEQSDLGNAFNFIENGDFSYGLLGWNAENSAAGDGSGTDSEITGPHPLRLDTNVLKITGDPSGLKKFNQLIPEGGKAGDVFVLGGWAKGDAVYNDNNSVYKLTLEFMNTDGTSDYNNIFFNSDTSEWQFTSGVFIAKKDYSSIKAHIVYHYNGNLVMFDGIHLYKGNQNSLAYDKNGNITNSTKAGTTGQTTINYGDTNNSNSPTSITDVDNTSSRYVYDSKHNLTEAYTQKKATREDDIRNSYVYDGHGNVVSLETGNAIVPNSIKSTNTYTTDGNYLADTSDPSGNTTVYTYDVTKGLLSEVKDPEGNQITYKYDDLTDRLVTSSSIQLPGVENVYGYSGDDLKTITHNGFDYVFDYDSLGNMTNVSVAGQDVKQNLITNSYNNRLGLLDSVTYGNGQQISYKYDTGDRLIGELAGTDPSYNYTYDAKGNLSQVGDLRTGLHTKYVYDFAGKLINVYDSWGWNSYFDYDNEGKITRIEENLNDKQFVTGYQYGDFKNLVNMVFGTNSSITYDYTEPPVVQPDGTRLFTLGRLNSSLVKEGNNIVLDTAISYEAGVQSSTSNRISQIKNNDRAIDYTYDKNGNIKTISEGAISVSYDYDNLNQLDYETHKKIDPVTGTEKITQTIDYAYDVGGNIKSKIITTTNDQGATETQTISYAYTDPIWKDKLISYDGKTITYDDIGNPLTYDGWSFTWDRGRELASMSGNGKNLSFTYNENGIRTKKTVDGVTTTYHLLGDAVTYEDNGTDKIHYTYGDGNNLVSMNLNGVEYYYERNAQNDIIGLVDSTGTEVVRYTYDSWGKPIVTDEEKNDNNDTIKDGITGSLADTVGLKNPYRYRGYRYDTETGLFYVGSRYYDPQIGRFINADDTDILDGSNDHMLENNLFAYCFNNPVNMTDDGGYWPSWATKVLIGAGAIVLGAAITVATGGAGAAFIPALVAGTQAALASAAIGAAVGAGASAVSHRVSTGSWKGAGKAALNGAVNGAVDGFMTGGIMAGASQAISGGFKLAANAGVKTGLKGGIQITKNVKVLSPNHKEFYDAGGTLLKIGSKASNIRFDVGAKSLFHMNVQFGSNIHVPIGTIGSGLYGGFRQW